MSPGEKVGPHFIVNDHADTYLNFVKIGKENFIEVTYQNHFRDFTNNKNLKMHSLRIEIKNAWFIRILFFPQRLSSLCHYVFPKSSGNYLSLDSDLTP